MPPNRKKKSLIQRKSLNTKNKKASNNSVKRVTRSSRSNVKYSDDTANESDLETTSNSNKKFVLDNDTADDSDDVTKKVVCKYRKKRKNVRERVISTKVNKKNVRKGEKDISDEEVNKNTVNQDTIMEHVFQEQECSRSSEETEVENVEKLQKSHNQSEKLNEVSDVIESHIVIDANCKHAEKEEENSKPESSLKPKLKRGLLISKKSKEFLVHSNSVVKSNNENNKPALTKPTHKKIVFDIQENSKQKNRSSAKENEAEITENEIMLPEKTEIHYKDELYHSDNNSNVKEKSYEGSVKLLKCKSEKVSTNARKKIVFDLNREEEEVCPKMSSYLFSGEKISNSEYSKLIIVGGKYLKSLRTEWRASVGGVKIKPYFLTVDLNSLKFQKYVNYIYKQILLIRTSLEKPTLIVFILGLELVVNFIKFKYDQCKVAHPKWDLPKFPKQTNIEIEETIKSLIHFKNKFKDFRRFKFLLSYLPRFDVNKYISHVTSEIEYKYKYCTCRKILNDDFNDKYLQMQRSFNQLVFSNCLNEYKLGEYFEYNIGNLMYENGIWTIFSSVEKSVFALHRELDKIIFNRQDSFSKLSRQTNTFSFQKTECEVVIIGDAWLIGILKQWPILTDIKPLFYCKEGITFMEIETFIHNYSKTNRNILYLIGIPVSEFIEYKNCGKCLQHEPLRMPAVTVHMSSEEAILKSAKIISSKMKIIDMNAKSQFPNCRTAYFTNYPVTLSLFRNYLVQSHDKKFSHNLKLSVSQNSLLLFLKSLDDEVISFNKLNGINTCDINKFLNSVSSAEFLFPTYIQNLSPPTDCLERLISLISQYVKYIISIINEKTNWLSSKESSNSGEFLNNDLTKLKIPQEDQVVEIKANIVLEGLLKKIKNAKPGKDYYNYDESCAMQSTSNDQDDKFFEERRKSNLEFISENKLEDITKRHSIGDPAFRDQDKRYFEQKDSEFISERRLKDLTKKIKSIEFEHRDKSPSRRDSAGSKYDKKNRLSHEQTRVYDEKTCVSDKVTRIFFEKEHASDTKRALSDRETPVADKKTRLFYEKAQPSDEKTRRSYEKANLSDLECISDDEEVLEPISDDENGLEPISDEKDTLEPISDEENHLEPISDDDNDLESISDDNDLLILDEVICEETVVEELASTDQQPTSYTVVREVKDDSTSKNKVNSNRIFAIKGKEISDGEFTNVVVVGETYLDFLREAWSSDFSIRPHFVLFENFTLSDLENVATQPLIKSMKRALIIIVCDVREWLDFCVSFKARRCPAYHPDLFFPRPFSDFTDEEINDKLNKAQNFKNKLEKETSNFVIFSFLPRLDVVKLIANIFADCKKKFVNCMCNEMKQSDYEKFIAEYKTFVLKFNTGLCKRLLNQVTPEITFTFAGFPLIFVDNSLRVDYSSLQSPEKYVCADIIKDEVLIGRVSTFYYRIKEMVFPRILNKNIRIFPLTSRNKTVLDSTDSSRSITSTKAKCDSKKVQNSPFISCSTSTNAKLIKTVAEFDYSIIIIGDVWLQSLVNSWPADAPSCKFYYANNMNLEKIENYICSTIKTNTLILITLPFEEFVETKIHKQCLLFNKRHSAMNYPVLPCDSYSDFNALENYSTVIIQKITELEKHISNRQIKCKIAFSTCFAFKLKLIYRCIFEAHNLETLHLITDVEEILVDNIQDAVDFLLVCVNSHLNKLQIQRRLPLCDLYSVINQLPEEEYKAPGFLNCEKNSLLAKKVISLFVKFFNKLPKKYCDLKFGHDQNSAKSLATAKAKADSISSCNSVPTLSKNKSYTEVQNFGNKKEFYSVSGALTRIEALNANKVLNSSKVDEITVSNINKVATKPHISIEHEINKVISEKSLNKFEAQNRKELHSLEVPQLMKESIKNKVSSSSKIGEVTSSNINKLSPKSPISLKHKMNKFALEVTPNTVEFQTKKELYSLCEVLSHIKSSNNKVFSSSKVGVVTASNVNTVPPMSPIVDAKKSVVLTSPDDDEKKGEISSKSPITYERRSRDSSKSPVTCRNNKVVSLKSPITEPILSRLEEFKNNLENSNSETSVNVETFESNKVIPKAISVSEDTHSKHTSKNLNCILLHNSEKVTGQDESHKVKIAEENVDVAEKNSACVDSARDDTEISISEQPKRSSRHIQNEIMINKLNDQKQSTGGSLSIGKTLQIRLNKISVEDSKFNINPSETSHIKVAADDDSKVKFLTEEGENTFELREGSVPDVRAIDFKEDSEQSRRLCKFDQNEGKSAALNVETDTACDLLLKTEAKVDLNPKKFFCQMSDTTENITVISPSSAKKTRQFRKRRSDISTFSGRTTRSQSRKHANENEVIFKAKALEKALLKPEFEVINVSSANEMETLDNVKAKSKIRKNSVTKKIVKSSFDSVHIADQVTEAAAERNSVRIEANSAHNLEEILPPTITKTTEVCATESFEKTTHVFEAAFVNATEKSPTEKTSVNSQKNVSLPVEIGKVDAVKTMEVSSSLKNDLEKSVLERTVQFSSETVNEKTGVPMQSEEFNVQEVKDCAKLRCDTVLSESTVELLFAHDAGKSIIEAAGETTAEEFLAPLPQSSVEMEFLEEKVETISNIKNDLEKSVLERTVEFSSETVDEKTGMSMQSEEFNIHEVKDCAKLRCDTVLSESTVELLFAHDSGKSIIEAAGETTAEEFLAPLPQSSVEMEFLEEKVETISNIKNDLEKSVLERTVEFSSETVDEKTGMSMQSEEFNIHEVKDCAKLRCDTVLSESTVELLFAHDSGKSIIEAANETIVEEFLAPLPQSSDEIEFLEEKVETISKSVLERTVEFSSETVDEEAGVSMQSEEFNVQEVKECAKLRCDTVLSESTVELLFAHDSGKSIIEAAGETTVEEFLAPLPLSSDEIEFLEEKVETVSKSVLERTVEFSSETVDEEAGVSMQSEEFNVQEVKECAKLRCDTVLSESTVELLFAHDSGKSIIETAGETTVEEFLAPLPQSSVEMEFLEQKVETISAVEISTLSEKIDARSSEKLEIFSTDANTEATIASLDLCKKSFPESITEIKKLHFKDKSESELDETAVQENLSLDFTGFELQRNSKTLSLDLPDECKEISELSEPFVTNFRNIVTSQVNELENIDNISYQINKVEKPLPESSVERDAFLEEKVETISAVEISTLSEKIDARSSEKLEIFSTDANTEATVASLNDLCKKSFPESITEIKKLHFKDKSESELNKTAVLENLSLDFTGFELQRNSKTLSLDLPDEIEESKEVSELSEPFVTNFRNIVTSQVNELENIDNISNQINEVEKPLPESSVEREAFLEEKVETILAVEISTLSEKIDARSSEKLEIFSTDANTEATVASLNDLCKKSFPESITEIKKLHFKDESESELDETAVQENLSLDFIGFELQQNSKILSLDLPDECKEISELSEPFVTNFRNIVTSQVNELENIDNISPSIESENLLEVSKCAVKSNSVEIDSMAVSILEDKSINLDNSTFRSDDLLKNKFKSISNNKISSSEENLRSIDETVPSKRKLIEYESSVVETDKPTDNDVAKDQEKNVFKNGILELLGEDLETGSKYDRVIIIGSVMLKKFYHFFRDSKIKPYFLLFDVSDAAHRYAFFKKVLTHELVQKEKCVLIFILPIQFEKLVGLKHFECKEEHPSILLPSLPRVPIHRETLNELTNLKTSANKLNNLAVISYFPAVNVLEVITNIMKDLKSEYNNCCCSQRYSEEFRKYCDWFNTSIYSFGLNKLNYNSYFDFKLQLVFTRTGEFFLDEQVYREASALSYLCDQIFHITQEHPITLQLNSLCSRSEVKPFLIGDLWLKELMFSWPVSYEKPIFYFKLGITFKEIKQFIENIVALNQNIIVYLFISHSEFLYYTKYRGCASGHDWISYPYPKADIIINPTLMQTYIRRKIDEFTKEFKSFTNMKLIYLPCFPIDFSLLYSLLVQKHVQSYPCSLKYLDLTSDIYTKNFNETADLIDIDLTVLNCNNLFTMPTDSIFSEMHKNRLIYPYNMEYLPEIVPSRQFFGKICSAINQATEDNVKNFDSFENAFLFSDNLNLLKKGEAELSSITKEFENASADTESLSNQQIQSTSTQSSLMSLPGIDLHPGARYKRLIIVGPSVIRKFFYLWLQDNWLNKPYFLLFNDQDNSRKYYEFFTEALTHEVVTKKCLLIFILPIQSLSLSMHKHASCKEKHPSISLPGIPNVSDINRETTHLTQLKEKAIDLSHFPVISYYPVLNYFEVMTDKFKDLKKSYKNCCCTKLLLEPSFKNYNKEFKKYCNSFNSSIFSLGLNRTNINSYFDFKLQLIFTNSGEINLDEHVYQEPNDIKSLHDQIFYILQNKTINLNLNSLCSKEIKQFLIGDWWLKELMYSWPSNCEKPIFFFQRRIDFKTIKTILNNLASLNEKIIVYLSIPQELFVTYKRIGYKKSFKGTYAYPIEKIMHNPFQQQQYIRQKIDEITNEFKPFTNLKLVYLPCLPIKFSLLYFSIIKQNAVEDPLCNVRNLGLPTTGDQLTEKLRNFTDLLDKDLSLLNRSNYCMCKTDIFSEMFENKTMDFYDLNYLPKPVPKSEFYDKLCFKIEQIMKDNAKKFSFMTNKFLFVEQQKNLDSEAVTAVNTFGTSSNAQIQQMHSTSSIQNLPNIVTSLTPLSADANILYSAPNLIPTVMPLRQITVVPFIAEGSSYQGSYPETTFMQETLTTPHVQTIPQDSQLLANSYSSSTVNLNSTLKDSISSDIVINFAKNEKNDFSTTPVIQQNKSEVVKKAPYHGGSQYLVSDRKKWPSTFGSAVINEENDSDHEDAGGRRKNWPSKFGPAVISDSDHEDAGGRANKDGYVSNVKQSLRRGQNTEIRRKIRSPNSERNRNARISASSERRRYVRRSRSSERKRKFRRSPSSERRRIVRRSPSRERRRIVRRSPSRERRRNVRRSPSSERRRNIRRSASSEQKRRARSRSNERKRKAERSESTDDRIKIIEDTRENVEENALKRKRELREEKKREMLRDLWKRHTLVCERYRKRPQDHSDFNRIKDEWFMNRRGPTPESFNSYWVVKRESIFNGMWEKIKENCLRNFSYSDDDDDRPESKRSKHIGSSKENRKSISESSDDDDFDILAKKINAHVKKDCSGEKIKSSKLMKGDLKSVPSTSKLSSTNDSSFYNDTKSSTENILEVTGLLFQISDKLGALGLSVSVLHNKITAAIKEKKNPVKIFDADDKMLLSLISDKVDRSLSNQDISVVQKAVLTEASERMKWLIKFLETDSKEPKHHGLDLTQIAVSTIGKSVTDIVSFIKAALLFNKVDISSDELMKIYMEVKCIQKDMVKS